MRSIRNFLGLPVVVSLLLATLGLAWTRVGAQAVQLRFTGPDQRGWRQVIASAPTNRLHILQQSTDLATWSEAGIFRDGDFRFTDVMPAADGPRYFRTSSRSITANDDGKNQVRLPDDAFANEPPDLFSLDPQVRWIKFLMLLPDPTRVFFQDSAKYAFHFDYASRRIERFKGMTRTQFDAATLVRDGQQAVLGALLLPPDPAVPEYGIQFVGRDAYPKEDVARWFEIVRAAVLHASPAAQAFYVPTYEQAEVAAGWANWFLERNIPVASANRWLPGDVCYSEGWAFGRLTYVPAAQIDAAYQDGRLRAGDILITDGVPAEVPFVAGIISVVPATPNSHVAILARSFGIPFVYPADAVARSNLLALAGREVVLRVGGGYTCDYKVLDVEGTLPSEVRSTLVDLKKPPTLNFPAKEAFGAISTNANGLRLADTRYFGGKAANFGLLRRIVPGNSPTPAIAFSFDLWDAFRLQVMSTGKTLRQEIHDRLAGFSYPPNLAQLTPAIATIQGLIRSQAQFTAEQQSAILLALQEAGFDLQHNVRFRSSSNLEDSDQFTGAGLYDSYSGCPADDLDADAKGPSICDSTEVDERGVFRALRRVYASFYNQNAVIERLRLGIDEEAVGMAVLAHPSYPDSDELANGVATVTLRRDATSRSYEADLVTQVGAVSVTNPDGSALPEEVTGYYFAPFGGDAAFAFNRGSSLLPLGGHVLTWESEYRSLLNLLLKVTDVYAAQFPQRNEFTLDFEYKKVKPGRLELKQVRSVPVPDRTATLATVLIDEPTDYEVFQGERGDVFSNHRLKSLWHLGTVDTAVKKETLASSLFRTASVEFLRGTNRVQLTGGTAAWLDFKHAVTADYVEDSWRDGSGAEERRFRLQSAVLRTVSPPRSPIITQQDFEHTLTVGYSTPQIAQTFEGFSTTKEDNVRLIRRGSIVPSGDPQRRSVKAGKVTLELSWYWPAPPRGPSAGYTAPLAKWDRTRIAGLTAEPIVLVGEWSQTYHPFHHNFVNEFLFEPALEPGVGAAQLAELRAADVKLLYVAEEFGSATVYAIGFDGKARRIP